MTQTAIDTTLESRSLYIKVCVVAWFLLMLFCSAVLYLLRPGLVQIHESLFPITATILGVAVLGVLVLVLLLVIVLQTGMKLPMKLLRLACGTVYAMLPYCILIGKIVGISKERIGQSLVDLINAISMRYIIHVEPKDVMLLTPHCLQLDTCPIKVTRDAFACKQCGRCCVGGLVGLAKKYGTSLHIATGGTFARLLVKKYRPKVIIAIACERDLVLGMRDVFPILVFGVLNQRPFGPCFNTKVDLEKVEKVLQHVLHRERNCYDSKRAGLHHTH